MYYYGSEHIIAKSRTHTCVFRAQDALLSSLFISDMSACFPYHNAVLLLIQESASRPVIFLLFAWVRRHSNRPHVTRRWCFSSSQTSICLHQGRTWSSEPSFTELLLCWFFVAAGPVTNGWLLLGYLHTTTVLSMTFATEGHRWPISAYKSSNFTT